MAVTLEAIVDKQVQKVLRRGTRMANFDQIRQRHFWSTYLFIADPTSNQIAPGGYDLFKTIPGASGQGYPSNINLTVRETNWLNAGRVPDNQNFAITEIGATIRNPPLENPVAGDSSTIYANLQTAQKTYITANGAARPISAMDVQNIAMGMVLEMSFLTNNVPLGLIADFSQSAGIMTNGIANVPLDLSTGPDGLTFAASPSNGIAAAAFRRKLDIPIMLQHGENMGMRLTVPRPITMMNPAVQPGGQGGTGWAEVRIDWWAIESFTDKS